MRPPAPRILSIGIAALLSAGALALWAVRPGESGDRPAAGPVAAASSATSVGQDSRPEASPPRLRHAERQEGAIRRGESLSAALRRVGLSGDSLQALLTGIDETLDPRRLPVGTGLIVDRWADGRVAVAIRPERERFLRVKSGPDHWNAAWVEIPRETRIVTAGGTIRRSVTDALAQAELSGPLTLAFADVVQWDVDLLIDPRPGDHVGVVYEVHRLGRPPEDLPAFPRAAREAGETLGLGRVLAARYDGRRASVDAFSLELPDGQFDFFDQDGRPLRKTFLKSPLNYRRISSGFSLARRHPISGKLRPHRAVDFAAPHGTPVVVTADGTVDKVGWMGALGRAVRVRHNAEYSTVYGHLSGVASGIRRGVRVTQNQVIGRVGSTGSATGAHLHYELHRWGGRIDPLRFESPVAEPLPAELAPDLLAAQHRWRPVLTRGQTATLRIASHRTGPNSGP